MYAAPGSKTPITGRAVRLIVAAFIVGVVCLVGLFILATRHPALIDTTTPQGGYQCYFYRDADGDGRGNPEMKLLGKLGETPPAGYTLTPGDCDDNDPKR